MFDVSDVEDDDGDGVLTLYVDPNPAPDANYTTDGDLGILINPNYNGDLFVPVYVKDSEGLESEQPIQCLIEVEAVNDAPFFDNRGDITILEDTSYEDNYDNSDWAFNISSGAYNEQDNLDFIITFEDQTLFEEEDFWIDSNGNLFINPILHANGETNFTVYLTDNDLNSESVTHLLTIEAVNDIPEWNADALDALPKFIYEDCESIDNINILAGAPLDLSSCNNNSLCEWSNGSCLYIQDINTECTGTDEGRYALDLSEYVDDIETNSEDLDYSILIDFNDDDAFSEIVGTELFITPNQHYNGLVTLYFLVTDGEDTDIYPDLDEGEELFELDAIALNDGPVIDEVIPTLNLVEDFTDLAPFFTGSTIDLKQYFRDFETDDNNLVYTYSAPDSDDQIDISIDGHELTIESVLNSYKRELIDTDDGQYNSGETFYDDNCDGEYTDNPIEITVTARDDQSRAEISFNFNVNVTARNDQLYWEQAIVGGQINEDCGETHNGACTDNLNSWYTINLSSYINTDDRDGVCISEYTYSIEAQTVEGYDLVEYNGSILDNEHQYKIENEILYVKPKFNFNGPLTLLVEADDNNDEDETSVSDSDPLTILLNVNSVNDGPYFNQDIPDITVDEFDDVKR